MKIAWMLLVFLTVFSLNTFAQDLPSIYLGSHRGDVSSVSFSPDGQTLASGSEDDTIRLWDPNTGQLLETFEGHTDAVNSVAFSPDGLTLASGSSDNTIHLWNSSIGQQNVNTGQAVWNLDTGEQEPDAGEQENANTERLLKILEGHRGSVNSVAFSPDGLTLASGSNDSTIRLWNVATRRLKATLTGHTNYVVTVAFNPDGLTLASGSTDNTIHIWDADTGAHLRTLTGHRGSVSSVSFSPDGQTLASGSLVNRGSDRNIHLWDAVTGADKTRNLSEEGIFRRGKWNAVSGMGKAALIRNRHVYSVVFSPDGQTLASGVSHSIRLWELPATQVSITPSPTESPVVDAQLIVSVSIVEGQNVGGYQVTVGFDETAFRYVESANGDYLPAGAFFAPPVVDGNHVTLGATSRAGASSGDGTLATLTFEVIDVKESLLALSDVILTDSDAELLPYLATGGLVIEPPHVREDVNRDKAVNIQDLVQVAARLNQVWDGKEDVNQDGVVNIVDLVKVAGAIGGDAAAPSLHPQALAMLNTTDVQQWLSQAQHLNLTDVTSQRGILFLEQLLEALTPKETSLLPNYPNPFNPETWIPYQLAESADVTLRIYAVDGAVVRTLKLGHQPVGTYQDKNRAAYWDGKNEVGESVASGVYFYTLTADDFTATRKMLIQK